MDQPRHLPVSPDGSPEFNSVIMNPSSQEETADDHALIVRMLWRRKYLLFACLLAGLSGGYLYFTKLPETYSASSVIEIRQAQTRLDVGDPLSTGAGAAPGVAFLRAEMVADAVLLSAIEIGQLTKLEGTPTDPAKLVPLLRGGLQLRQAAEGTESKDRAIIEVAVESGDPTLSTLAVDSILAAYDAYLSKRYRENVGSAVVFFRESRDTLLPELNELEKQYVEFRKTAPLEWTPSGEAVNPFREEVARTEESLFLAEAEARRIDMKLSLMAEVVEEQPSALMALKNLRHLLDDLPGPTLVEKDSTAGNPVDAEVQIQQELLPKVVQAEILGERFGKEHPARRQLEREISETKRALRDLNRVRQEQAVHPSLHEEQLQRTAEALLHNYRSGLEKKRELIERETSELEARLAKSRARAHKLITFENEDASYRRKIERYQSMLDSVDSQLERSSLADTKPGLQVEVLRQAGKGQLVGPRLSQNLLMGSFLGAMLGCTLVWLLDWADGTFRTPDEVADALSLPILGHLPLVLQRRAKRRATKHKRQSDLYGSIDPSIVVVHDPHSGAAEAIRGVRTGLLYSGGKQSEYQVIQVTSAMPSDGKSTIVGNLAASIARAEKRVLIVDADLRRPLQRKLFGIDSEAGLTSVLNGDLPLAEAIHETEVEGLYVLPAGATPTNPSEAVMLPEFGQILDDMRMEFDVVIVDSPPLLPCTDASNISVQVDGVLFVMRIGRNAKPQAQRAMEILRSLRVNLIGVIVNAVGDSTFSTAYASASSGQYAGRGSKYAYSYSGTSGNEYLRSTRSQAIAVQGRTRRPVDASLASKEG